MRILLIDFSNLLFRSIYAHPTLSFGGHYTGGGFGLLVSLAKLLTDYPGSKVIICKDSPPYLRKQMFPEYKSDRKMLDETTFMKLSESREQADAMLQALGIPILAQPGLEADDIIGLLVQEYYQEHDILIASSDSDLYQLLKYEHVSLIQPKRVYDKKSFDEEFSPIIPAQWPYIISLAGSHNGVPGIKGVGIKTACKYLQKGVDAIVEKYGNATVELMLRNIDLASIPLKDARIEPPDLRASYNYDERQLLRVLSLLGIKFTGAMQQAFNSL